MQLDSFKSIVSKYKVVFFDSYGVLKNHRGLIPGIHDTIDYLKELGIDFYLLTNDASRSPEKLAQVYNEGGIDISSRKVISSGMIAREYLRYKVTSGTVAYLGTEQSSHYIAVVGLKTISISDVNDENQEEISALVLLDDEGFDWNVDINTAINLLRHKNIPVVVANTDFTYPVAKNDVALAIGGIGEMLERIIRKRFIHFGKPDTQMFNFAFEHVQKSNIVSKNEILMVGDTLNIDILGANKFGIDTALVLTGNTQASRVQIMIETMGIVPDYICESVVG